MRSVEEAVRIHLQTCPDHEVSVGLDDEWYCVTCEKEADEEE